MTEKEKEINQAMSKLSAEYFRGMLELAYHTDQDKINYMRTGMTTPDGGKYVIAILHVDGPVISFDRVAEMENGMDVRVSETRATEEK